MKHSSLYKLMNPASPPTIMDPGTLSDGYENTLNICRNGPEEWHVGAKGGDGVSLLSVSEVVLVTL